MNTFVKSGLVYWLLSLCSVTVYRKMGKTTNLTSAMGLEDEITQVTDMQPEACSLLSTSELPPLTLTAFQVWSSLLGLEYTIPLLSQAFHSNP